MIAGLLILDRDDQVFWYLPKRLHGKDVNHYPLFEGISEGHVILYGRTAWKERIEGELPGGHDSIPLVNKTIKDIRRQHPYRPILVVGNNKVLQNYKYLSRLIVVKYNIPGEDLPMDTCVDVRFVEPRDATKRLVVQSPFYTVYEYGLKHEYKAKN